MKSPIRKVQNEEYREGVWNEEHREGVETEEYCREGIQNEDNYRERFEITASELKVPTGT